ncbi:hypothetical protein RHSIM_Rhsim05G0073700 [Rhododendron simsii]|uniref:KIB1-4 beta-propeller domain-containing protein n=1 Tax=Rhododendron simsii TaxID=118357 RepID=A0A834LMM0_RHOSS|nr:hypothetical protein RHSIM_Rhsim05G0073700 [Rhododendron simsii]
MEEETTQEQQQWSLLPREILITIAKCLNKTTATAARVDTLRLRSVCKSWRSSIPTFKQQQETLHFPLSLPFPISPNPNHNLRGRFSLAQSSIYFLQPAPSSPSSSSSKSSSLPWLLRVEEKDADKGRWKPLNPLSKVSTDSIPKWFPKSLNLLDLRFSQIGVAYSIRFVHEDARTTGSNKEDEEDWTTMRIKTLMQQSSSLRVDATLAEEFKSTLILRVAVSLSPWSGGDDYAIMAIHNQGKLGFYKLGDEKWILISDESKYHDVVHHRGKFYAVDYQGGAVVIDSDLKAKQTVPPLPGRGCGPRGGQIKFLVKSGDDHLYLVDKFLGSKSVHLEVYKLNETNKKWERVNHLNDQVFFVGDDCCFSVSTQDFPALKGNCIYFPLTCYNFYGEEDFCDGVQDLENGKCGPVELFQPDHMPMFTLPTWLKSKPPASKK